MLQELDLAGSFTLPRTSMTLNRMGPCGENGEFHSFVYAGPMLSVDIPISVGESVVRDQFVFADLKPSTVDATPLFQ